MKCQRCKKEMGVQTEVLVVIEKKNSLRMHYLFCADCEKIMIKWLIEFINRKECVGCREKIIVK